MVRVISVSDVGIDIPHPDAADGISYELPFIPSEKKESPKPTRKPLKRSRPKRHAPAKPLTLGKELL